HASDKHRSVDDTPAGGGPGMVMRADVLARAVDAVVAAGDARARVVMSPRGVPLTQRRVAALAEGPGAVILCGRFEGIDERLIEGREFEEVSIGDYVLSGGEIASLVTLDACVRLLPGVMGKEASGADESFENGLLEYPHYTRPRDWEGRAIPDVLLSGDHAKIARWRRDEAERLTRGRRPQRILHGPQDFLWRGRRARLPDLFAEHRFDQGRAPRQGASRQALLPARPSRQVGPYRRKDGDGDREGRARRGQGCR